MPVVVARFCDRVLEGRYAARCGVKTAKEVRALCEAAAALGREVVHFVACSHQGPRGHCLGHEMAGREVA